MTETQPQSLYKYLEPGAGATVLETGRLRWSAPAAFDDPFELDHQSSLDFDPALLEKTAARAIANAVFSRQAPTGLPGHPMTNVIRRWRAQRRFSHEEEVYSALRMVLPAMVERRKEELAAIVTDWQAFATRVRILCLNERHNDVSLWRLQADRHRGVVLRLSMADGGSFDSPQAVAYHQRRPQITTLAEQVSVLLGQARYVAQEHFRERLLVKARAEAQEREWRCFRNLTAVEDAAPPVADAPPHDELPFEPEELQAVYLGARMAEATRERLLALLAERYPATRVLQQVLLAREFGFEFQPLGDADEDAPGEPAESAPAAAEASAEFA